ncbi:urea carboxylase-associated family protein [uncultured Luteimonas sp.]|uniref:urea carboxylase-associated family protein n=1 Tax=uncultured Luteimonas sp. TaxID=453144 RepID=UPI002606B35F|nr:urea carboxylase-associated family protein [uncultured Luteimonas sp.]
MKSDTPQPARFERIAPCSGRAVELDLGDELIVLDPMGQQVSDLTAFAREDRDEYLSSGRSIDYASKLWLTTGDVLYSNRSRPMFTIVEDSCGRHDFTLTPCSKRMFELLYGETQGRPGCEGNLAAALAPYGIGIDRIPIAFNIFMHVAVDADTGAIAVRPPLSRPGDFIRLRAQMPLVVAMTACSAGQSNNFSYKPIDFRIERAGEGATR